LPRSMELGAPGMHPIHLHPLISLHPPSSLPPLFFLCLLHFTSAQFSNFVTQKFNLILRLLCLLTYTELFNYSTPPSFFHASHKIFIIQLISKIFHFPSFCFSHPPKLFLHFKFKGPSVLKPKWKRLNF
jgi:hypothetical protein